ncbi:MAG: hypothetical protein ACK5MY_15585 [Jhaorihella sp.]
MLKIALLTLTLTADGALRLTLSDMESASDCEASRENITAMLTESGINVVAAMCGETDLRLTAFEHGAGPEAEVHLYRVETDGAGFSVSPLGEGDLCVAGESGGQQVYCTRSSQAVIPGG